MTSRNGPESPSSRERFLLIRPDRVGDVVLATPLIRAIRESHPGAYIAALVRPYAEAVLWNNPRLNRVFVDDLDGRDSGCRGFWSLALALRRERFGISLMLLPTRRHAWLTLLAGIPLRISVGRKPYEVLTGCKPAGRNRDRPVRHEADYCMDLGRTLGVESENLAPEVFLSEEERKVGRVLLGDEARMSPLVVGLHPGNGGSAPNWEASRYVSLAGRLVRDLNARVVVTGWGSEIEIGRMMEKSVGMGVINLAGRLNLRELMQVIASYDAMVSSSTGPMHLAAALGIPCVALFCPRPACCPTRWGPLGRGHRVLLAASSRCDRCGPVRDPECSLEEISVESVLEAVAEAAKQGGP